MNSDDYNSNEKQLHVLLLDIDNAHARKIISSGGAEACDVKLKMDNYYAFITEKLLTQQAELDGHYDNDSIEKYRVLILKKHMVSEFLERRIPMRVELLNNYCSKMNTRPCDTILINQITGTCWLNAYLNGIILSYGTRCIYAKIISDYISTADDTTKRNIMYSTIENTVCPLDAANDTIKRNALYAVLFKVICSFEKPGKYTDVAAHWAPALRTHVSSVVPSTIFKLLSPPQYVNFGILNVFPYETMIINAPLNMNILLFDFLANTETTKTYEEYYTKTLKVPPIRLMYVNNKAFKRQYINITVRFQDINNNSVYSAHAIVGAECGGERFIYDSNYGKYQIDWTQPNLIDELRNHFTNNDYYYSRDVIGCAITGAVYAQEDAIEAAKEVPLCTFL